MLDKAIGWIKRNTLPGQGIIVNSRQRVCYPEVTGYFIPTLISIGERELARQYAAWLLTVQRPDGSFGGADQAHSFAFDTGQVIRGWVSLLEGMPELAKPIRLACDWLLASADPQSGRLPAPAPGGAWSLGNRGEVNEAIHLYVLPPLRRAGELLQEKRYLEFVERSLQYYLHHCQVTDFAQANALTHFYAYMQEALLDLGCEQEAKQGMASVAQYQQPAGAVPAYADVAWICSTGLAQLAQVWFRLHEWERAEKALDFLVTLQNPSGGFFGSYGVQADYFPAAEISWAVKYAIEAEQRRIASHFDQTVGLYQSEISESDGRVQAILRHLGNVNGKRVLDAGCGKGRYAALIKRHFPQAIVEGVDISAEMLRHVPAGIPTFQGSLLDLPFAAGRYHAVICIEALEHVAQATMAIKELSRVLAPGGVLLIIDKNKQKLGALRMPHWEKWFDQQELAEVLQQAGLTVFSEPVSYDQHTQPDGLFLCWAGHKTAPPPAIAATDPPTPGLEQRWQQAQAEEMKFWHQFLSRPENRSDERWLGKVLKNFGLKDGQEFPNEVLIDIGCGPIGILTRLKALRRIGIDPLPVPSVFPDIERITSVGESIPLPDLIADKVFAYNLLQHVKNPDQCLDEMVRLTKPDGSIFLFDQLGCPISIEHPQSLTVDLFYNWLCRHHLMVQHWSHLLDCDFSSGYSRGASVLVLVIRKSPGAQLPPHLCYQYQNP